MFATGCRKCHNCVKNIIGVGFRIYELMMCKKGRAAKHVAHRQFLFVNVDILSSTKMLGNYYEITFCIRKLTTRRKLGNICTFYGLGFKYILLRSLGFRVYGGLGFRV